MDEENNINVCEVCDNDPCTCEEDEVATPADDIMRGMGANDIDIPEVE